MSVGISRFKKQPGDVKTIGLDFCDYFEGRDDVPANAKIQEIEQGITAELLGISGTVVWVRFSGGVYQQKYAGKIAMTTSSGDIEYANFSVTVRD